jgi:tetratricopeptide (TPR) repeat protein
MRKIILALAIIMIIAATTLIFHQTQSFYKLYSQGERLYKQAEYEKAARFFLAALKLKPGSLKTAAHLLWTYERLDDKDALLQAAERVLALNPKDSEIVRELGDIYYSFLDYPKAEVLYRRALALKTDALVKKRLAEVLAWQKKYPEAALLLEELARQKPGDAQLIEFLADIYAWEKEYDQAALLYRRLLSQRKRSPELVLKLAEVLRFSGNDAEAIKLYNQYLAGEKISE